MKPLNFEALRPLPEQFLRQLREFVERVATTNEDAELVAVAKKNADTIDQALLSLRVQYAEAEQ